MITSAGRQAVQVHVPKGLLNFDGYVDISYVAVYAIGILKSTSV